MARKFGPLIGFVVDALVIGAVGVGLAAVYLAKLEEKGALLRSLENGFRLRAFDHESTVSRASDLLYGFFTTPYFAWTDMSQNVFDAVVLVQGGSVYRDAVTNHMPGVAQLVALVLWMAGFAKAVPGMNTATAAFAGSCLATVLFQLTCAFVALRILQFSRSAAVALSVIPCAYTAFAYNFAHPMSETLIAYLFVLVPVLVFRMLYDARTQDRVVHALMLGGPFTLLSLDLGLTAAPANAFLWVASLAVGLREHRRDRKAVYDALLHDRRSWLAYILVGAIIVLSAATVHVRDAWFWVVDVNRVFLVNPFDVIMQSFASHFRHAFRRFDPIGSRYPHLLGALAFFAVGVLRSPHRTGRAGVSNPMLVFIGLICTTAVLTQWRTDIGVKSVTVFGLTLGTVYLALHLYLRERRAASDLWLLPLLAACALQANVLVRLVGYDTVQGPRHAALDAAKVCRAGETGNCRCIQLATYAPQLFLWNDMRPCRSRFAALAFVVDRHPVLRQMMIDDVRRPDMAFWTYSAEVMRKSGLPEEPIRYLETQSICFPLDGTKAICTAGP